MLLLEVVTSQKDSTSQKDAEHDATVYDPDFLRSRGKGGNHYLSPQQTTSNTHQFLVQTLTGGRIVG